MSVSVRSGLDDWLSFGMRSPESFRAIGSKLKRGSEVMGQ
jgi:hypothetical protein